MSGYVKAWTVKEAFANEIKSDEQASDPAIPIEERMDGFELVMADRDPDEMRHLNRFVVPERF